MPEYINPRKQPDPVMLDLARYERELEERDKEDEDEEEDDDENTGN